MEIKKVLETIFIKEWNTTALILEDEITIRLFEDRYFNKQELFDYIKKEFPGWVQSSEIIRKAKIQGATVGINNDPILPYENLYDELEEKYSEYLRFHKAVVEKAKF